MLAAALLAARRGRAALPARRRRAGAVPRRGRVRGARAPRPGTAFEPLAPPQTVRPRRRDGRGRRTTTGCSSSTRRARPGKPKGAVLTHANCFWTNLSFDLATGVHRRRRRAAGAAAVPLSAAGTSSRCSAWWKGATVRARAAVRRRRACCALIEEKRVTTMMGVPAIYLFLAQQPGFARRRPVEPAPRGRRRRADARGAARDLGGARHRDRPGLRPHGGGAERPLPAAGGRDAQARLRRQAVPVRRRAARRRRRAAGARAERLPGLLAESRGDARRRSRATAGCAPATSPSATTRGATGSRGG